MSKFWKSTLKLPRSTFPARPNPKLQPQYLRASSAGHYEWQATHRPHDSPFILHDGPPYANGPLHVGHAINKILKDTVLRVQIQSGRRMVYRPSWDCHGLPIEMKAVGTQTLKGLDPVRIRQAARQLASKTIRSQMKEFQSFGVMADWKKKWTTMDHGFEIAQLRVFQGMLRRGLIYRRRKPVYWSISSGTALAEAELEYRDDHISRAAYVRFPITMDASVDQRLPGLNAPLFAMVWTTTPWTLPANQAIAVRDNMKYAILNVDGCNLLVAESRIEALKQTLPTFEILISQISGSQLVGLRFRNKLRGRAAPDQPIVEANFVTDDAGTGLVHLAPGHGQDDYLVCSELGIEPFSPVDDRGHFTEEAYPDSPEHLKDAPTILEGGSDVILQLMGDDVLGTHSFRHKYPYDWRTKQPVIVRATAQWFADVGSIKDDALRALESVRFIPETSKSRLESFIKGRSEWCISRQRAWGVPIPALYGADGEAVMTEQSVEHIISVMQSRTSEAWFSDASEDPAWIAPSLQGSYCRGTDTMDVWFDSGSSWTQGENPADLYLEGSDQHRGWFQSSLLTYVAAQDEKRTSDRGNQAPFQTLVTHGFTLDQEGRKMSKSLGNTVTPQDIMEGRLLPPKPRQGKGDGSSQFESLGPDALRLWALSSDFTKDVAVGPAVLQPVHSALIRYRTILKMMLGSLHETSRSAPLTKLDQIALLRLKDTMKLVWDHFQAFEYYKAVSLINRWVGVDLSAFYLEALKDRLYCGDGGGALEPMLVGFLRMLTPVTPLLVEEAWVHRPQWMDDGLLEHPAQQLYESPLVDSTRLTVDEGKLQQDLPILTSVHEAVKAGLEEAREAKVLGSSLQCSVFITTPSDRVTSVLAAYADELEAMYVVSHVCINQAMPEGCSWSYEKSFEVRGAGAGTVHVLPPKLRKCSRCWQYKAEQDGLCRRCEGVVGAMEAACA